MEIQVEFERLFEGRKSSHGFLKEMLWNKINAEGKFTKDARTRHSPPDVGKHLRGEEKIGIIPFVENDRCTWGGVDVDEYVNFDHAKLMKKLREKKIPGVVTRSTNGGAHIWFFFKKPVPSHELKKYLRGVRASLGYNPMGEVFPKQDILKKTGSFLFLPYYPKSIDEKNKCWVEGCNTYGLNDNGQELSLEDFIPYANKHKIDGLKDMNVSPYLGEKNTPDNENGSTDEAIDVGEELKEAPPCVQYVFSKRTEEGKGRDSFMFAYAMYLMKKNSAVSIKELKRLNEKFDPGLSYADLQRIQRQVMNQPNKTYNCTQVENYYCNKELCKLQQYGIGGVGKEASYFSNYLYIKNLDRIAKLKPQPTLLKVNEAKNNMKVEKGNIKLGPVEVPAGELFMLRVARKQSVDNAEWHPGKEQMFTRKGVGGDIRIYNSYQPTTLEPVEGSVAPWEDYIDKRFKNEECKKYFLDFLAHKVQHPEVRTMSNILLISDWGGTGKSLIDETMQELLGIHNTASIDLTDMQSGWADIIMNKVWISVEEIHDTGESRTKIASIIKRLTTIKRMFGNMKYGKFQQAEIYASLYFMSNSKTAMSVKETDRRPFIYQLDNDSKEEEAENNAEGDMLVEWLKEDQGYEKLLHNFKNRDLSNFSPTAWPPQTKAKAEMVSKTYRFKYEAIIKAWESSSWPFTRQSRLYAPRHIANMLKCDEDEVERLFEKVFKCEKLKRVQGIDFVIYDRNDGNNVHQVDSSRQDIILWTDDEELLAQKKVLSPKDCMAYYLHPCMSGQRKMFAQDDRQSANLLSTLTDQGRPPPDEKPSF